MAITWDQYRSRWAFGPPYTKRPPISSEQIHDVPMSQEEIIRALEDELHQMRLDISWKKTAHEYEMKRVCEQFSATKPVVFRCDHHYVEGNHARGAQWCTTCGAVRRWVNNAQVWSVWRNSVILDHYAHRNRHMSDAEMSAEDHARGVVQADVPNKPNLGIHIPV